ncbi:methyltransferase domain-containing protein [Haladaptatus caseinilyticus]|uniref:methyltransferase domain-containing protein n=1 Tax=Haladaptatus caseinilyticus TaxID=2993314 RepID=UPI00224AEFFC|nr:methyltransferase domain-containing protein [Haladaptatus caseinilyticus]
MTILLVHGDREYLRDPGEELQTDLGVLTVPEDVQPGDTLMTHLDEEFTVRRLRGPDLFHHFERTGAPMLPRDIGLIVGETGISAGDRVLDAGTGTGVLAGYLGRIGADVVTFERKTDFAEVARENIEMADVADRVDVRTGDITENMDDLGEFDVLTLDTPDAAEVVAHAPDLLADGGSLGVYAPFVESARDVELAAREANFDNIRTMETIQREMDFDDRGTRPTTTGVGHTGYLLFARNV